MVATKGQTFKRPWRRSCLSSKLKSSSAPIGRKDSWCFHAVGSSNAPLLGSTAAEGLPRIGRTSIATRWRSCGLPQSASCSENFVIPPDVFGQTLRVCFPLFGPLLIWPSDFAVCAIFPIVFKSLPWPPRSMKMGTIVSPWLYDAGACHAPQSAHLRRPEILHRGSSTSALPENLRRGHLTLRFTADVFSRFSS